MTGLTEHTIAPYKDGYRVMVSRGEVGPVSVSGLLTKSQAESLRDQLAERQQAMLAAYQATAHRGSRR